MTPWSRWVSVLLCGLGLLLGCPAGDDDDDVSGDDDATGDDDTTGIEDPCEEPDETCCAEPGDWIAICFDMGWPGEVPVTGQFSGWGAFGYGDIQFVAEDGTEYDAWIEGSDGAWALLPDLSAAGQVTVVQRGGCDGKGGFYNAVAVMAGQDPDHMLFIAGNVGATDLFGWTVETDRDVDTCPARPGDACNEFLHNRPIVVSRGDDGVVLYQGQTQPFGQLATVHVGIARSGSGEYLCMDGGGTEYDAWLIVAEPNPEV